MSIVMPGHSDLFFAVICHDEEQFVDGSDVCLDIPEFRPETGIVTEVANSANCVCAELNEFSLTFNS